MIVGVIAEELLLGLAVPIDAYVDPDIFFTPTVRVPGFLLLEGAFNDGDTIYQTYVGAIDNSIFPPLVAVPDTVYAFATTRSIAIVAPSFTDVDAFYSPIVLSKVLGPQLFIDVDVFGGVRKITLGKATINQTVPIQNVIDADIIYGPIVERAGVTIITRQAGIAANLDYVHLSETQSGVAALEGSLVQEVAGYTPPLGYLSPHIVAVDDAIPSAGMLGPVSPAFVVDTDVIYAPARLNYVLPGVVSDADVVMAPSFGRQLLPGITIAADVFNGPFFTQPGSFAIVIDAAEFIPSPTVAPQGAPVAPSLAVDADAFYPPSVNPALVVSRVSPDDLLFTPVVRFGALTPVVSVIDPEPVYPPIVGSPPVTPALFIDIDAFFVPMAGYDQGLLAGLVIDTDTFYTPTIAASASFNGTLALGGPIMPATPPLTVIYLEG